ncbi:MAG: hypothetical protein JNK04_08110, partial [Myxococcales bacterium]|nr:hypothetical protein [Myxococcales bacterium]
MSFLRDLGPIRVTAMISIAAAAAMGVGVALTPEAPPPPPAASVPVPALRIAGHLVPAEGDAVGNAFDLLRRYALGEIKLRLPDGSTRALDRTDFGVEI